MGIFRDSVTPASGAWPWTKAVRTGGAVSLGFGVFAAAGYLPQAVLCAAFANLLSFLDFEGRIQERLTVISGGAVAIAGAAALGTIAASSEALVVAGILIVGAAIGLLTGSPRYLDLIARQALIGFIVGAYLPQIDITALPSGALGAALVLSAAALDHARRGPAVPAGAAAAPPPPGSPSIRFAACYAAAAALGFLLADQLGATRPFWVTLTTLVVMLPDRRASALRAIQRVLGTTLGVLAALAVTSGAAALGSSALPITVILVLPFLWPLAMTRHQPLGVALLSAWILVLIDQAQASPDSAYTLSLARLSDTVIGCAFAVAGTFVAYWPRRSE